MAEEVVVDTKKIRMFLLLLSHIFFAYPSSSSSSSTTHPILLILFSSSRAHLHHLKINEQNSILGAPTETRMKKEDCARVPDLQVGREGGKEE
jgi:hypothetical protein